MLVKRAKSINSGKMGTQQRSNCERETLQNELKQRRVVPGALSGDEGESQLP